MQNKVLGVSTFKRWITTNREHLAIVLCLSHEMQLEHERECPECQEGLRIAIECLGWNQITQDVTDFVNSQREELAKGANA
jgi:hypothetical protein